MFYNRSGIGVNIEKYAEILDDYILWNYEKRTKPSFCSDLYPMYSLLQAKWYRFILLLNEGLWVERALWLE